MKNISLHIPLHKILHIFLLVFLFWGNFPVTIYAALKMTAIVPYNAQILLKSHVDTDSPFLVYIAIEGNMEKETTLPLKIQGNDAFHCLEEESTAMDGTLYQQQLLIQAGYNCRVVAVPFTAKEAGSHAMRIQVGDMQEDFLLQVSSAPKPASSLLKLTKLQLPVRPDGSPIVNGEENQLYLKDTVWLRLQHYLSPSSAMNPETPDAYIKLYFSNPTRGIQLADYRCELLESGTDKPIDALYPLSEHGNEKLQVSHLMQGKADESLVLPLFVDTSLVKEGHYILRFITNDEDTFQTDLLIRKNHSFWFLFLFSLSIFMLLGLFVYRKKLQAALQRFSLYDLILLTAFAVILFICVGVPNNLLMHISKLILGPLSFLFTGLFSSILFYTTVIIAGLLVPRAGSMGILLGIKYLISAAFFGSITPTGCIHFIYQVLFLEIGLYALRKYPAASLPQKLICVLICMLDALLACIDLEMARFFYRIYYAAWYAILLIAINSCLYTAIGFYLGLHAHQLLTRVKGD